MIVNSEDIGYITCNLAIASAEILQLDNHSYQIGIL